MMKAIRLVRARQPLELFDLPVPQPGPQEALVRVMAAGICHSDAHYRAGRSPVHPLPLTLGHEVAGVVERLGEEVRGFQVGERVCLHYMLTCGHCEHCDRGQEQFCRSGKMIGKYADGGYAEFIVVPARSLFHLPDEVPFAQGAVLMCSSATALHALRKARLTAGERVAVFGAGGLGISAIQLARAAGAGLVLAVDIRPDKLALAARLGAIPVDATAGDPVKQIRALTGGRGADVALELIGLPLTMDQAFRSLGVQGRLAIAGLSQQSFEVAPYRDLINREAEIIGVSDHLAQEIPLLLEYARRGVLDLSVVVTQTVPLDPAAVNTVLDGLESFGGTGIRTVIIP
jgi:2-desacetyl-2-hydroxyethyl bacteriochlorophyllide A dehydrogenase